jgi:hypothetical protein
VAAYGFDRAVDHVYWQQHARRTTWPDSYSYAFLGGGIGPVAGRDAALRGTCAPHGACPRRGGGTAPDPGLVPRRRRGGPSRRAAAEPRTGACSCSSSRTR